MQSRNRRLATPERRARAAILFQFLGVVDIVLGALVATFGRSYFGGDPIIDIALLIGGIVIAVLGVGVWWFGYFRLGRPAAGDRTPSVVDRG